MKNVDIPNKTPSNKIHGTETITGVFRDIDGKVVGKFEHPPGKTVPVQDVVESVDVVKNRAELETISIAEEYR